MDRRGFLKNSIGALLFAGLTSNKVLAEVVETLTPNSPNVLLYLIQNKKGYWFVRGTSWIKLGKEVVDEEKYNIETFKSLEIVNNDIANIRRLELWKIHKCGGGSGGGTGFPLNIIKSRKAQQTALTSEGFKNYVKSELKKINSSILGKKNAEKGIPQKNGLKVLNLPVERRLEIYKKSASSRVGRKADNNHKESISKGLIGKSKSEEHKRKLSLSKIGVRMDDETKKKISKTLSGEGNHMYGKTHSEESRKKISDNNKAYHVIRICPHCNKTIKGTNYFRHHGDRCKLKQNIL